jgi:hypothetical protein
LFSIFRNIIFVLCFTLSFFAKAQVYTVVTDTAVVRRSVTYDGDTSYYMKKNHEAGRWIVYYDTTRKQIAFDINYKSHDRYDLYSWYRNGQQKTIQLNIDSMSSYRSNYESWYPNGQHFKSIKYTRDSCVSFYWFPNGHLLSEYRSGGTIPWREDLWRGETKTYTDGYVSRIDISVGDSTITKFLSPDQKIWELYVSYLDKTAPNFSRVRIRIDYYDNGQLRHSILYPEKGRQQIIYYYESGAKQSEGEWENGKIGIHKEYFEDGKLKSEGEYIISQQVFHNSFNSINYYESKSGCWLYYNEEGKIIMEEWYSNTEWNVETVVKYKTFDKNGKVETEGEKKIKKLPVY